MSEMVSNLTKCGMIYLNPTSPWASASLLVPKPGPAKFRFAVDLRPVTRFTIEHQFPMPIIEQELLKPSGYTVYATFDLSHGYWQLPLEERSQSSQSFITPDGIFSLTRVLLGSTNAVLYLQSTLGTKLPPDLSQVLLRWIDDILCHAPTIDLLFLPTSQFFEVCLKFNFKLHPEKCVL